jgi:hypothetical protein
MNTCGSVVVCSDVCFVTASQKCGIIEQCYAITFCVKLGKGATDTYEKIQKAFGNDSASHAQIFWWHKDFVNGREMVEYEPRSGHPASVRTSTNVHLVRVFIHQDQTSDNSNDSQ